MKSFFVIAICSINVSLAQVGTFKSVHKTAEEFLIEPNTSRLLSESGNFKVENGFTISCGEEIVLYQYTRIAHAHGVLFIIRFDDVSMEIFRENLSTHVPSYQGKIISLDSSNQVYKGLIS